MSASLAQKLPAALRHHRPEVQARHAVRATHDQNGICDTLHKTLPTAPDIKSLGRRLPLGFALVSDDQ